MNNRELIISGLAFCFLLFINGCDINMTPHDGMSDDEIFTSLEGIRTATNGNYAAFKGQGGVRRISDIDEFPADNVALSGVTSNPLFFTYSYEHVVDQNNTNQVWTTAYKIIAGANQVIENVDEGQSSEIDQLLGENYFLRAINHFRMVNIFGRPYSQGADNLGIPIIDSSDIENPARNTVGEVYNSIEADLKKAAELMTIDKNNNYASREVAYGLLSRLFLYKEDNEKAIEYANKVMNSGRYELADAETHVASPTMVPENNPETMFAIRHTIEDDEGNPSIGSFYYRSPEGVGWGEMYASEPYREILGQYPEDIRHEFINPNYALDDSGNRIIDENGDYIINERNGYEQYYIMKFSYQEGNVTLSSPVILRLAEMYLNRAEAYAKLGQDEEAIDDVNTIRERAGLSGDALYSTGDLKNHNTVLDVVLEERRLELAWEGHRKYDVFRNNRTMNRDYPGTHQVSSEGVIIPPDHPRVVHYIHESEMILNPNLEQNP